jgi:hypothetical protein
MLSLSDRQEATSAIGIGDSLEIHNRESCGVGFIPVTISNDPRDRDGSNG